MKNVWKAFLFCLVFVLQGVKANAQELETSLLLAKEFPDEDYLILYQEVRLEGVIEKGKLVFYENTSEDKLYLNKKASMYLDESLEYNLFQDLVDVEAVVYYPHKNVKYKKLKVTDFTDSDVFDQSIFYHDQKKRSWQYPQLGENYITSLQYQYRYPEPHFIGSNYMQLGVPILKNKYVVTVPNEVEMGFILWNTDQHNIEYHEEKGNKTTTYSWTYDNIEGLDLEDNMPPVQSYLPIVIPYVKKYSPDKEKEVVVLNEIDDLFTIYEGWIDQVDNSPTPEIDSLVTEITRNAKNDREKASAVFYWVQDNIKYIAFEDGLGGFIPRPCSLVFQRKYGDCKDMTSMLIAMLTSAEIPVYYTWIGTRDIPYRYDEVWTPIVDNHMIAACEVDGELLFIDGTSDFIQLGYPSIFTQGKQALVRKGHNEFELINVPIPKPENSQIVDTVHLSLSNENIIGRGNTKFSGYFGTNMKDFVQFVKSDKQKEFFESYFEKGNNRFTIEDLQFINTGYGERPVDVQYSFSIPQYAYVSENEMYINLHLDQEFASNRIESERVFPIEKRFKSKETYVVHLEIPTGWEIQTLPKNVAFENEKFGFQISYTRSENEITLTTENYLNTLVIEPEDFEYWNEMVNTIKQAYSESIVLHKTQP